MCLCHCSVSICVHFNDFRSNHYIYLLWTSIGWQFFVSYGKFHLNTVLCEKCLLRSNFKQTSPIEKHNTACKVQTNRVNKIHFLEYKVSFFNIFFEKEYFGFWLNCRTLCELFLIPLIYFQVNVVLKVVLSLKGTVQRDFWHPVFYYYSTYLGHWPKG